MRDYEIIDTNTANISSCSLCRYKAPNNLGRQQKTAWLKERNAEGVRYKVLRSPRFGDIGMIEYTLWSHAWRPVEAEGYLFIHCLMVKEEDCRTNCWSGGYCSPVTKAGRCFSHPPKHQFPFTD